ncbi:MAG: beta-lactamase family protein, partial [Deltaproteobacteria bacterium]|nr:beta-lactamase family protein [Deltaproteobacteria bacterium]
MKRKLSILIICISLCILIASCGSNFTIVKEYSKTAPESVGLSSQQLDEITKMLKGDVAKGRIPGAVAMVFRKGEIPYLVSVGMQDKRADIPMTRDSIFRIYSMTKPIVSVAAMILCDEGRLHLDDPISKYLPEFKTMKVGVEIIGRSTAERDTFYTVPAKGKITVRDLHMHTAGLTYGVFGTSAVKSMYLDAGVPDTDQTLSEKVRKISRLPLAYQPGTVWEYSRSHDVLGRLVEIVSGVTLDRFLKERIFRPLGMKNTGFYVKSGNHGRIAQTNSMIPLSDVTVPPKLLSGGGGLV